ncbi:PAS domain S-box protein [Sphingobium amiense]|uniref:histidine kinase n=1 Tax=Sphingobium amiense TaxID=135719 RepID=A0A494W055_9SPHN|nr:ATP-binding protein [Sphingobium amiense]BBD96766.1 PAS domain S-box protein [Sphingobium amiense]
MTKAPQAPRPFLFIALALLFPLVLAASLFWLGTEYQRWNDLREEADRSFERRITLIDTLSELRAAESSQRGYVITHDPEFRARYREWRSEIGASFAAADIHFRSQAAHRGSFLSLRALANAKIAEMDAVFRIYDTQGAAAAQKRVSDGEGKRLMSRLQAQLNRIIAQEQQIGRTRLNAYRERTETLQRLWWLFLGFSTLSLVTALVAVWRNRASRYELELSAYEAAQRNETILNSTIDPIIIINPSGSIETINLAASRMLGYQPNELARRDFDLISDIASGVGTFLERIGLADGTLRTHFWTDCLVRHKSGRKLPVDIALGVMALSDGEHIVASFRDIAERKRIEQLKDNLISTVSHELRTPLTSIVGALALLKRDTADLTPQSTGLVAIAENNAQRLIRLINDMLDIDRIEAGKLRMALTATDLRDVILHACEDFEGLARSANVAVQTSAGDDPVMVQGDAERLQQVLTNLLSNAIKISPAEGKVTVGLMPSGDRRRAIVYVDDDGPGIPPEFRARIFGRFERAGNGEAAPGTGLGLAIAREIMTQHGGELWFEDRPQGGTRFALSLPTILGSTATASGRDEDGGASILICESNAAVAKTLQSHLAEEGYFARIVTNAAAARAEISANSYSLLLLDMALDDADAFDFAREVRRHEGPESLSILMIASPPDADAPLPLDLVDWIDKPVDVLRLKTAISAAFRQPNGERPVVLHLDDDQDTLEITASALEGQAYMLKARTLDEARALLGVETPHLAILDMHLEEGYGLDLLPHLFDEEGVAIPTIIYSAHDIDPRLQEQVSAVLTKSRTSLPDLKATVRRVIAAKLSDQGEAPA